MKTRTDILYASFEAMLDSWSIIGVDEYYSLIVRAEKDLASAIDRHEEIDAKFGRRYGRPTDRRLSLPMRLAVWVLKRDLLKRSARVRAGSRA